MQVVRTSPLPVILGRHSVLAFARMTGQNQNDGL
jgi:hypothetical protein